MNPVNANKFSDLLASLTKAPPNALIRDHKLAGQPGAKKGRAERPVTD
jgi:hypothetical protein